MREYFNLSNPQLSIWETAINKFIEVNDSIRLQIKVVNEEPMQFLSEYKYKKLDFVDFTGKTKEEQDTWISDKMQIPFTVSESDLFEFIMIKSWDGEYGCYAKFHHTVSDAWTISLTGTQLMEYYQSFEKSLDTNIEKNLLIWNI